jgi:6-phosphogluconolactonase/glucosamine-6-phosphate isomerase/deaminase
VTQRSKHKACHQRAFLRNVMRGGALRNVESNRAIDVTTHDRARLHSGSAATTVLGRVTMGIRIVANRAHVAFVAAGAFVDTDRVQTLLAPGVDRMPLAALEEAAGLLCGEFRHMQRSH